MRIAVVMGSSMGGLVWHDLLVRGLLAGVAIPQTGRPEQEQLAAVVASTGFTPQRLHRDTLAPDLTAWILNVQADVVLVLTFPWRIPAAVLNVPPYGFLNYHFAPLPAYRGPEPLFWLLRSGATAGAVTIHRMEAAFDTGPVVVAEPVLIGPTDTFGWHRRQLTLAAVPATRKLLDLLQQPAPLPATPQQGPAHYWPRPALADVCIHWSDEAAAIANLIRAANPWNQGAVATLRGQPVRLLVAVADTNPPRAAAAAPGTVLEASAAGLVVACGANTALRIDVVSLGDDGFFSGQQLATLGLRTGDVFGEVEVAAAVPA